MKTCKEVVYEKQQYTCYKTCYERVCEQKTDQLRQVRSRDLLPRVQVHGVQAGVGNLRPNGATTRSASRSGKPRPKRSATRSASRSRKPRPREICYTVCKPVWETKTKEICYTVCKPVWETQTKEICYTVCKPVWETKTKRHLLHGLQASVGDSDEGHLLHRLQAGLGNQDHARSATRSASRSGKPRPSEICYTVCKPVWETKTRKNLLHGLQAGLRDSEKVCQLHGLQAGVGNQDQGDLLHGLQAGPRDLRARSVLHGLQAGEVHQDDQGLLRPLGNPRSCPAGVRSGKPASLRLAARRPVPSNAAFGCRKSARSRSSASSTCARPA